jgi:hypothetical protein
MLAAAPKPEGFGQRFQRLGLVGARGKLDKGNAAHPRPGGHRGQVGDAHGLFAAHVIHQCDQRAVAVAGDGAWRPAAKLIVENPGRDRTGVACGHHRISSGW